MLNIKPRASVFGVQFKELCIVLAPRLIFFMLNSAEHEMYLAHKY